MHDVDGLNAGYAKALLEEYLENPDAVPEEWRRLFESGSSDVVAAHPGLARLLETLRADGNGHRAPRSLRRPSRPTRSSCERSQRRRSSSAPTARSATSPPGSIRSAPSRSATQRSSPTGPSRR